MAVETNVGVHVPAEPSFRYARPAAFVKDAEYDANCVVLVRMGTKVKGDAVVFYLNEDKAELWNFLKERFKGRL